jgi:hypothetical protein
MSSHSFHTLPPLSPAPHNESGVLASAFVLLVHQLPRGVGGRTVEMPAI